MIRPNKDAIKQLRNLPGVSGKWLTQEELADKAGISRRTVSSIERTGSPATLDTMRRISEALSEHLGRNVPVEEISCSKGTMVEMPKPLGLHSFEFGKDGNENRNCQKVAALDDADGVVILAARTGNAYFSGALHESVLGMLNKNADSRFEAYILNPFSNAAVGMYVDWLRKEEKRLGDCNCTAMSARLSVKHRSKLIGAIRWAKDKLYGERLKVAFTSFDLPGTVLWTPTTLFYEPYFRTDEEDRTDKGLQAFELICDPGEEFGQLIGPSNALSHLNYYRSHSAPFDKFRRRVDKQCENLKRNVCEMKELGELRQEYADAILNYIEDDLADAFN